MMDASSLFARRLGLDHRSAPMLLALELAVPGAFMMWLGLAAVAGRR